MSLEQKINKKNFEQGFTRLQKELGVSKEHLVQVLYKMKDLYGLTNEINNLIENLGKLKDEEANKILILLAGQTKVGKTTIKGILDLILGEEFKSTGQQKAIYSDTVNPTIKSIYSFGVPIDIVDSPGLGENKPVDGVEARSDEELIEAVLDLLKKIGSHSYKKKIVLFPLALNLGVPISQLEKIEKSLPIYKKLGFSPVIVVTRCDNVASKEIHRITNSLSKWCAFAEHKDLPILFSGIPSKPFPSEENINKEYETRVKIANLFGTELPPKEGLLEEMKEEFLKSSFRPFAMKLSMLVFFLGIFKGYKINVNK